MDQNVILFSLSAVTGAGILYFLWRWDVIRPGSFPPRQQRDVEGVPTAVWLLGAMLVFLGQAEGSVLAAQLPASVLGAAESLQRQSLVSLGGYGGGLGMGLLMFFLLRGGERLTEESGLAVRWADVGRGAVAMVLLAPIYICVAMASSGIAGLVSETPPDKIAHGTLKTMLENRGSIWTWVMGACAILGAPVVEEIIYRAFLQSCLLRTLGRVWPAIIGTSALFAAMHYVGGAVPLHAVAPLFVLSIGMGIAYERTRGIATSITMHVLFNAGNVVIAMLMER